MLLFNLARLWNDLVAQSQASVYFSAKFNVAFVESYDIDFMRLYFLAVDLTVNKINNFSNGNKRSGTTRPLADL